MNLVRREDSTTPLVQVPGGKAESPVLPGFLRGVEEIDLAEVLSRLWRQKWIIVGTVVVCSSLALAYVMQLTPRYTAMADVLIDTRKTQVINLDAVVSGLPPDASTIESEMQLVRSRRIADRVIDRLSLDQHPEFNPALRPPSKLATIKRSVKGAIMAILPDSLTGAVSKQPTEVLSEREQARQLRTFVVDAFLSRLGVNVKGLSRVISISFESESPKTAAQVVNTLADLYIVSQLEAKFEATRRATQWLNERVASLRENVENSEKAVEDFREASDLFKSKDATLVNEEVSILSTQLVQARASRSEAEVRLGQVEEKLSSPDGLQAVSEVLNSDMINRLRLQETELGRRAAELAVEYGERHPKMINVQAELSDLRQKINLEVQKIVDSLRNEVAVAREREKSLQVSLEEAKQELAKLNKAEVQLRTLEREADANRTLFQTFLARFKETSVQENYQEPDASVISYADVPSVPSYPKSKLILAASILVSGCLGVLLAFMAEQLDRGFRSLEQVEQMLGVPALGLLPALKGLGNIGKAPESYILEKPASAFGEAVRSMHTSLLLSDVDRPPKVVLIASSLPREGKTSVVLSLARFLASVGKKTVVVDCDLRRPSAHKAFGAPSKPGLVECLAGEKTLREVIHRDAESSAYILPAGAATPNPPDLLGSERMKMLLKALVEHYDLVIVDSAPVLAVSDTRVLSRLVDKTIFLVRWTETRRETARAGIRQLLDIGCDIAGVVLTMVDVKKHARFGFADSGMYTGRVKKYYTG